MKASVSALALALASLVMQGPALAEDHRTAMKRAVAAKERALDSGQQSDWLDAFELMQKADALASTAVTKYELGFAAAQAGYPELARECYEAALASGLSGSAADKARAFLESEPPAREVTDPATSDAKASFPAEQTDAPSLPPRVQPEPRAASPVRAPEPARRSEVAKAPSRTAEWVLLGAGASVSVLALGFLPVAQRQLTRSRESLAALCAEQRGSSDGCAHAKPGALDAAQSASDSIATWKAMRTISWVGLGVGVSALLGSSGLLFASPASKTTASATLHVEPGRLWLGIRGAY